MTPGLVLLLAACSANPEPTTTPAPAGDQSAAEIERLYNARQDSARNRFSPADVQFMHGMIAHHAQAISMSLLAPARGASSAIQTLAGRVINAQKDEISVMQQWLRDRKQPVPELHIEGTSVMVHGPDHSMTMPGMLTAEQMKQLEQARGADFDRTFLTLMIQHHKGAVTMVRELFNTHGAMQEEAIFKLANDVQVDQITEIDRMEKMLAALRAPQREEK